MRVVARIDVCDESMPGPLLLVGGGGGSARSPCSRAAHTPRIVRVLPVPGGPWTSAKGVASAPAAMAANCDALEDERRACQSGAGVRGAAFGASVV